MPRASSSAKRHHGAANQRDTRHENGLVGPGKRIPKSARNSQSLPVNQLPPDGSVSRSSADDAAHCLTNDRCRQLLQPCNQHQTQQFSQDSAGSAATTTSSAVDGLPKPSPESTIEMAPESRRCSEPPSQPSVGAGIETSSAHSLAFPPADTEEHHRRIDVNAAKNVNVHRDPGPIDFAFTVLRSCPLYDTIAILIILMHLSPIALSSIYMLFTLLTFVPPVHTSSGLSLTEMFEGSLGTPSLTTLACMDVVFLLVWLFLWGPLQLLILDFAQVVIALTLGGGATTRQGSSNNICICIGLVLFSHFGRLPSVKRLSAITSALGMEHFFPPDPNDPIEPMVRALNKRGAYSWIRNVFAIHILTQGIVRYIREWYLRREKRDLLSQSLSDPEAGRSIVVGDLPEAAGSSAPDVDGTAQTSAAAATVSTKRKKKQSAQVRIRQPLWAALASTKIVMVKEYELSHAASESLGSEATDVDNLGNAPFYTQAGQIWLCYVGPDEVCFNTSAFPHFEEGHQNGHGGGHSFIDTSKPFFVRVNKAIWQPTRIIAVAHGQGDEQGADRETGPPGTSWTGDVYGLTPASNYEVEFVSTTTGEVLFSTSVRTAQAPTRHTDAAAATAAAATATTASQQRRRHESPATTIKASIATQEAKLNDEKAKLKSLRKDNNRKLNSVRKEIDKLSAAVLSAGGNDEKLRQKITQNTVQQKQAEVSMAELEDELKELHTVPEQLLNQHRAKQGEWTSEKAQFDGARASFKSFKNAIGAELKALEEEQAGLHAKRSKITTRIAKADNDHARITDANTRGLDEAERRRQERAVFEAEAARIEQSYLQQLKELRARNDEKAHAINTLTETMRQYLSTFDADTPYEGQSRYQGSGYAPAPWSASSGQYHSGMPWPSTSGAASGHSLAPGGPPALLPNLMGNPQASNRIRGRSSSMLSDVSGFTQSSEGDDEMAGDGNANGNGTNGYDRSRSYLVPPAQSSQAIAIRSPPGFTFTRTRENSGSGSSSGLGAGSGSGSRSGSGSGSSVQSDNGGGDGADPLSPV